MRAILNTWTGFLAATQFHDVPEALTSGATCQRGYELMDSVPSETDLRTLAVHPGGRLVVDEGTNDGGVFTPLTLQNGW